MGEGGAIFAYVTEPQQAEPEQSIPNSSKKEASTRIILPATQILTPTHILLPAEVVARVVASLVRNRMAMGTNVPVTGCGEGL